MLEKLIVKPFDWDDNLSSEAIEDFLRIIDDLPYGIAQTIAMALAKLELLEKQGCKVKTWKEKKDCENTKLNLLKDAIRQLKSSQKSLNSDYATGYISALSAVEGLITALESEDKI